MDTHTNYLEYTFGILPKNNEPRKDKVGVFICCAHFINIIVRQILKKCAGIISSEIKKIKYYTNIERIFIVFISFLYFKWVPIIF